MNIRYPDLPVIDAHVHIVDPYALSPIEFFQEPSLENADCILEILDSLRLEALNIPAISLFYRQDISCNPLSLYAKTLRPASVYAFAGLCHDTENRPDGVALVQQLLKLLDAGFDGVKMICKPNARRMWNIPINDPGWDPYYDYLAEHSIPLLYHVGDPETFWDPTAIPGWARHFGYFYGDDKMIPTMPVLRAEIEDVLNHFPNLNVIFAHFLFMSQDLDKAAAFLERHPNAKLDLTPGSEMYIDFSRDPERAREFFLRYSGRLLYGTDLTGVCGEERINLSREIARRYALLRRFFETDGPVEGWGEILRGIALPKEVCRRIYADNFTAVVGNSAPKSVNHTAASELARQYIAVAPENELLKTLLAVFENGA